MNSKPHLSNIIISRTDSIGDVVLTLPVAQVIKQHFPGITIAFLGRAYTRPVIDACSHVDEFIDVRDFLQQDVVIAGKKPQAILHVFPEKQVAARAKALDIKLRIGTTNRFFHWVSCNKLVALSRRKSNLHEAQLNMKLLEGIGINVDIPLEKFPGLFGLTNVQPLEEKFAALLHPEKYNLILHPKSQGSAREWGLDNFATLVNSLDSALFKIFISGTDKERELLNHLFSQVGNKVTDITGLIPLGQFISFINHSHGLVANSTGPLHIAAALGKDALGIYPPMRPIHPGRWAPLGQNAKVFVLDKFCSDCSNNAMPCHCIATVPPAWLHKELQARAEKLLQLK
ncbi:glycosyltransferase family 9 protein [Foetidibacter luteolus]|uniref:glycosyltransferase family 9 protein n=1 Tax=Foetidibacter luteolus TaxID=2608880 RepID=UPI00129B1218|nr:glycosyltransferase family 9 protein [Foetidibacter luteolus]